MSFAPWRKYITEPALAPLRRQIAGLVPEGSTVFDLGCGHGRLLLELAPHILNGIGIDSAPAAIAEATARAEQAGLEKLTFVAGDAGEMLRTLPMQPNVAIAALLLHALEHDQAVQLLRRLLRISDRVIVADLLTPPGWLRRAVLGLPSAHALRRFAGHGGVAGLLHAAGIEGAMEQASGYPDIGLWVIDRAEQA